MKYPELTGVIPGAVDPHFHLLEMEKKGLDPRSVLKQCFHDGMASCIDVSTDDSDWAKRVELAGEFESLYLSAGFSPSWIVTPDWRNRIGSLETMAKADKVVAIGEIGLDWYWDYGSREEQIELFERQLSMAGTLGLPVIVHNRDADLDTLQAIDRKGTGRGGVLHCFSSDYDFAKRLMDRGFYISFAGNVTYKNSHALRDIAVRIPLRFLLLETDAPYLPPQPVRGRVNQPGYIGMTYRFIAESRGISTNHLIDQVLRNYRKLFFG